MGLEYRVVQNAKVQSFEPPIVRFPDGFRGGLVLTGNADDKLRHTRAGKPVDSFRESAEYAKTLAGSYIYAGPIYGHFGHFIAEMVHRIVPARALGLKHPILFVSSHGWNPTPSYEHFPHYVKEILAFLDVRPQDVRVVSENTIVETLHVVEPGSDLGGGPKPGYLDMLRDFSASRLDHLHGATARPEKIYVSRSALVPEGSILGERYLERELEAEGFHIMRPEELRFTPQMDFYRKAKVIVFPEGSACHGTELLGAGMMNDTFILPRREGQTHTFQRIIEPRAASFKVAGGVKYLGTASAHPRTGTPLTHIGVSWVDVDALAASFRELGLASLPNISRALYAESAEADFQRYLDFQARPGSAWDEDFASKVKEAFASSRRG